MTDDLDRFAQEIIAAALRDDQEALRENTHSLIVTCRQLRSELDRERAELRAARAVVAAARAALDTPLSEHRALITVTLAAYDAVRKR